MSKSIRKQIANQPKQHMSLLICFVFGVLNSFAGNYTASLSFIAASFVINAIIDSNEQYHVKP